MALSTPVGCASPRCRRDLSERCRHGGVVGWGGHRRGQSHPALATRRRASPLSRHRSAVRSVGRSDGDRTERDGHLSRHLVGRSDSRVAVARGRRGAPALVAGLGSAPQSLNARPTRARACTPATLVTCPTSAPSRMTGEPTSVPDSTTTRTIRRGGMAPRESIRSTSSCPG